MAPFAPPNPKTPPRNLALNPHSWEASFPPDQKTEANRLRFLARMSYIAIAQYLLYRGVLPKGVYKRRRIEDVIIYCFDSNKRWGHKLSEMMRGIREAIDKKYVKRSFIMINEDSQNPDLATEVFSINYCFNKDHALSVLDDQGNSIVSLSYKGEKAFRLQVKHIIKKLHAVSKHLKPLEVNAFTPSLKLTYFDHTPDDYEPPAFKPCENTYTFKSPATFYAIGNVTTNQSAIAFTLESTYIKPQNVGEMDDLLLEQAGYQDGDLINPMDVTADGQFTGDEQTPPKAEQPQEEAEEEPMVLVIDEHSSEEQVIPATVEQQSSDLEQEQQRILSTEVTTVSESIEQARQEHLVETLEQLQFSSPESVLHDDETLTDVEGSAEKNRKLVRQSPYAKTRSKRARNLTPRIAGTRRAQRDRDLKSSVSARIVLKSPTDRTVYNALE